MLNQLVWKPFLIDNQQKWAEAYRKSQILRKQYLRERAYEAWKNRAPLTANTD